MEQVFFRTKRPTSMQNRPCQDIQDCSLTCGKEQQLSRGGSAMDILRDGAVFEGTRAWRVKIILKTVELLY
jgi:hypothetical protein